ncbi:MAG: hypothetical protein Q9175_002478 [Cornicularia normoerica]
MAGLDPSTYIVTILQASIIERLNKMSTVPILGRVVSKSPPNTAIYCLKSSISRPLGPTRVVQDRSGMAKPFSSAPAVHPIMPTVETKQGSEIPSATVLSKLHIFGLGRDEPETDQIDYQLSRDLRGRAQEVRRQERLGLPPKENDGGTVTQDPVGEGGCGVASSQECSEQEKNDTVEGNEVVGDEGSGSDGRLFDDFGGDGSGYGGGGGGGDVG